jgi:hypothetical protein
MNGLTIQYDGFTVVLTAWVNIIPCESYVITLAIADTGDGIIDSGICLDKNSFKYPEIEV